ncbi:hypothetical protein CKW46_09095 [Mycobacterium liflandii]|nr:hypothetical protein CKW46_09095 [Mycobacterium liflandii]
MERETRLQLRSFRPALEHVDGAWWPRSRQLVDELPGLVASITERLGPIVMVSYHRNGWEQTPTVAEIAGHTVELLGFSSDDPASLILIGQDGHHLTLRVISPDASDQSAQWTLDEVRVDTGAGSPPAGRSLVERNVADIADKLARHEGLDDDQRTAQIKRWCEEAAAQFVDAPVQTFVPILVEHIVRNRMIESRGATRSPLLERSPEPANSR